ncbi:MAG: DUF3007 family protein [Cyanobacteria bacterium P01_G01_bin.54]
MRRIDVIGITLGIFLVGGLSYLGLQVLGINSTNAGIWSQLLLVGGVLGWVATYFFRVSTQTMTYNQQLKDYEEAVVRKKLEAMSPEELAALQAKVEAEEAEE